MPTDPLRAQFTDQELALREQARIGARSSLPDPATTARALALAICEVEAGLRSASQVERICHPSLWDAVANRIQRAGGPPVSAASVLRIQTQELTPGLVDAVAVVRRGSASGVHGVAAGGCAGALGAHRAPLLARTRARPAGRAWPRTRLAGYPQQPASPSYPDAPAATVLEMSTQAPRRPAAASRVERLVERAMAFAVEEYDDDLAVARLAWLARNDLAALDQA